MIELNNIKEIDEYFTVDKIGKEVKLKYDAIIPATGSILLNRTFQGIFLSKEISTILVPSSLHPNSQIVEYLNLYFFDSCGDKVKIEIEKNNLPYFGLSNDKILLELI